MSPKSFVLTLALTLVGCGNVLDGTDPESAASPASATTLPKPMGAQPLFLSEPSAPADEYSALPSRWRLFGVQGDERRTAVFANTRTWSTRELGQGELLARNLRVDALDDEGAWLVEVDGSRHRVLFGEEIATTEIRHVSDDAIVYLGRGAYRVDAARLSSLRVRQPLGAVSERVLIPGLMGLRLSAVDSEGLLARLGLKERDILLEPISIGGVLDALSRGEAAELRVFRRGTLLTLQYGP